jgi:hypothetical protein
VPPVSPIAATTKVVEDVNGGPLGVLSVGPVVATTIAEETSMVAPGPFLAVLIPSFV